MSTRLKSFKFITLATFALYMLISPYVTAQTKVVAPTGEFAKINNQLNNETIQILSQGNKKEKIAAIAAIRAAPENYAPPVFYSLSNVLFEMGEKDDASFWFYAGQLRARFDANRCTDTSARQAVTVLNQKYGTPINQYAFKDIAKLEALIPKVVDWDRKTPHNYDNRWINLYGMTAMIYGLSKSSGNETNLSLPEDQWNDIAEKTRIEYLNGFQQAMMQMKSAKM